MILIFAYIVRVMIEMLVHLITVIDCIFKLIWYNSHAFFVRVHVRVSVHFRQSSFSKKILISLKNMRFLLLETLLGLLPIYSYR